MDIEESIKEGVVEISYKLFTRSDATCDGNIRKKRLEAVSSNTHSAMSESADKRRKRYVDYSKGESKPYLIYGLGHLSDECKVLRDFGFKYVQSRHTKEPEHDSVPRNKFNKHQENNDIVNSAVDKILPHENEK